MHWIILVHRILSNNLARLSSMNIVTVQMINQYKWVYLKFNFIYFFPQWFTLVTTDMDIAVCAHAFRPIEPFLWVKQISDFFWLSNFLKGNKIFKKNWKKSKSAKFLKYFKIVFKQEKSTFCHITGHVVL